MISSLYMRLASGWWRHPVVALGHVLWEEKVGDTLEYRDRISGKHDRRVGWLQTIFSPFLVLRSQAPRPVTVGCELNGAEPSGGYTKRSLVHELPSSSFPEPALSVRAAIPIFESKSLLHSCHSCKLGLSYAVGRSIDLSDSNTVHKMGYWWQSKQHLSRSRV